MTKTSEPFGRRFRTNGTSADDDYVVALVAADEMTRRRLATTLGKAGLTAARSSDEDRAELDAVVLAAPMTSTASSARIRSLRAEHPDAVIVVVTAADDSRSFNRALDAGADGVVPEARVEALLAATLRATCAGLVTMPRSARAQPARVALSSREKQILGMVILGLANREIALKLHLAETTVKSHLTSVFRKLGVRSRSEAAALVLDAGSGLGLGILTISDGGAA